jgi:hypothetical protein
VLLASIRIPLVAVPLITLDEMTLFRDVDVTLKTLVPHVTGPVATLLVMEF